MDLENQELNPGATETIDTAPGQSTSEETSSNNQATQAAQVLAELDKMEKFKFEGREYTPKELKKAMMMQRDYSTKTTSLANERKAFEGERKYWENLHADLAFVQKNPNAAALFLKEYPEKFHSYLKNIFETPKDGQTAQNPSQKELKHPDLDLLSRLTKMESVLAEQETAKNLSFIDKNMDAMAKKYPDALPDLALAKVHDAYISGAKVDEALFDKAFKESDAQMKHILKTRYQDRIKKQTEANNKGKDVSAGGGTAGLAPKKFNNIGEVTKFAAARLSGRS
jgi:hypothetical protein